jgi:hypothetical protein
MRCTRKLPPRQQGLTCVLSSYQSAVESRNDRRVGIKLWRLNRSDHDEGFGNQLSGSWPKLSL